VEEDPPAAAPGGESAPLSATLEPPPRAEGSGTEDRGPLVLFIGTSLTEGFGLPDPASEAWPARLAALGREAGVPLRARNAGLSGETSAGALRRIGWLLEGNEPLPDVVVVETGANDGLRGLPVEEMEANLDALLARIREAAPRATLVVVGMEAPPNLGTTYAEAFRQVFPRVAARWDAVLVPFLLEGVAGEASLNQDDGIHPTREGHEAMARVAWLQLGEVLREAGRRAAGTTP
jgi:acyl-CoA thioesterase-1